MTKTPGQQMPDPVALRSPRHLDFFDFMFTRFFAKHMRALRVARWGLPDLPAGKPAVIFANHPSWWDGVAFMLLYRRLLPERPLFTPMDAAALEKYRFMKRLGVFGIETGSARGSVAFLRVVEKVLADPAHILWINAPGRFSDPRERPVPIAPGMIRLPELAHEAVFVPLALDYPFWSERKAEMLAAFGAPIPATSLLTAPREARMAILSDALAGVMEKLSADAIARDPAAFQTLVQGREGMGGIYQSWRRAKALLRGERFDPRHEQRAETAP
ncbi:MAG: lysophospholipid acyltransferase family protein [bacterium]